MCHLALDNVYDILPFCSLPKLALLSSTCATFHAIAKQELLRAGLRVLLHGRDPTRDPTQQAKVHVVGMCSMRASAMLRRLCTNHQFDILKFFMHKHPRLLQVWLLPCLRNAIEARDCELLRFLTLRGVFCPHSFNYVCYMGYRDMLPILLGKSHDHDVLKGQLVACSRGHLQILQLLLAKMFPHDDHFDNLLNSACRNGQLEVVQYLVDDVRVRLTKDHLHNTLLAHQYALIPFLLQRGVTVDREALLLATSLHKLPMPMMWQMLLQTKIGLVPQHVKQFERDLGKSVMKQIPVWVDVRIINLLSGWLAKNVHRLDRMRATPAAQVDRHVLAMWRQVQHCIPFLHNSVHAEKVAPFFLHVLHLSQQWPRMPRFQCAEFVLATCSATIFSRVVSKTISRKHCGFGAGFRSTIFHCNLWM
jgi:hypothetical protein